MIPYAYHENSTSTPPTRTRHCACHKTHVWNFGAFIHQGNEMRHNIAPSRQDQTQISAQRHPTPPIDHPANANPTVTAKETDGLTKRCTCAGIHASHFRSHVCTVFHTNFNLLDSPSIENSSKSFPRCQETRRRPDDPHDTNTSPAPKPPTINYKPEPFATHSEKKDNRIQYCTLHDQATQ